MMEWQPIETYDKMPLKKRPKLAAFYFKKSDESRLRQNWLAGTVQMSRSFGVRICTHWMPLPPPPEE